MTRRTHYSVFLALIIISGCQRFDFQNPVDSSFTIQAPKTAAIVVLTETTAKISWQDLNNYSANQKKNVVVEIQQSPDSVKFAVAASVSADSNSVVIPGIYSPERTYYFRLRIVAQSNASPFSPVISTALAFTAPEQLQVLCEQDTATYLQWTNTNPFISEFIVEQSINGSLFVQRITVGKDTTSIRLREALKNNATYSYRVLGRSKLNSTLYSPLTATTFAIQPPSDPKINHYAANAVELQWKDNTVYETSFLIERRSGEGAFVRIGTLPSNTTSYTDNTLDPSKQYEYRILATTKNNQSDPSKSLVVRYSVKGVTLFKTLPGHIGTVFSVALQNSGLLCASAGGDKTVKVWSAIDGQLVRTINAHDGQVYSVVFSPDGNRIVSGSLDKTVKIWNVADGSLIRTLIGHTSAVYAVAISGDGRYVASAGYDKTIRVWNMSDGSLLQTLSGHTQSIYALAFSFDGSSIASGGGDNTIKIWKTSDGSFVRSLVGHTGAVNAISISADGSIVYSGSMDRTIKIWNGTDGTTIRTIQNGSSEVSSLAVSVDGRMLITGNTQENQTVWSLWDYSVVQTNYAHTDNVNAVTVGADALMIVSGGGDALVKYWRVNNEWVQR